jgi:ferredoxin
MKVMITAPNLGALVDAALAKKYRVVAPRREKDIVLFAPLGAAADLCLDEVATRNSIKEFFFPPCEKIFSYELGQKDVTLAENEDFPRTLLLGGRACDAQSIDRLDRLFGWDSRDTFYFKHREATTVATIVCDRYDDACFCTSVGFTPRSDAGSDVLFVPQAENGRYLVEAVTDKGKAFLQEFANVFTEGTPGPESVADPPVRFDQEKVREFLAGNFEHPLWKENFLGCLGCATCAYLCPTCHCFDIVDEGDIHGGARFKNWDSCQFALFTRHTSGHNPRPSQDTRWRQRLRHKFLYFPDRFGATSCVGCGRCIRACPACVSILDQLKAIGSPANAESAAAAGKP